MSIFKNICNCKSRWFSDKAALELRQVYEQLPIYPEINVPLSESEWNKNLNKLRSLVLTKNPKKFLQWGVIKSSMFCDFFQVELDYMQSLSNWKNRWEKAIEESRFGKPDFCMKYKRSSSNLIHHSYHVAKFEECTNININNLDFVFEFGGGYGSMCRLFNNLGFKGKYIIFDFPHFTALQEYYLRSLQIIQPNSDIQVICTSNIEDLKQTIQNGKQTNNNLFLATWSFSEASKFVRDLFVPIIKNFSNFLIAYQSKFNEMDNLTYFYDFTRYFPDNIIWNDWQISHLPNNNRYLVGYKKV